MGGIEKRRRNTCGGSCGVMHIPRGALLNREFRQRAQTKRLRVTQIVLLGCDRQLLHIFDRLKVLQGEFATAEYLLIVAMRLEAKRNLVPKSLILKSYNVLPAAVKRIAAS